MKLLTAKNIYGVAFWLGCLGVYQAETPNGMATSALLAAVFFSLYLVERQDEANAAFKREIQAIWDRIEGTRNSGS